MSMLFPLRNSFTRHFSVGEEVIYEHGASTRITPYEAVIVSMDQKKGQICLLVTINGIQRRKKCWYRKVRKRNGKD